jgi:hypothetical protein
VLRSLFTRTSLARLVQPLARRKLYACLNLVSRLLTCCWQGAEGGVSAAGDFKASGNASQHGGGGGGEWGGSGVFEEAAETVRNEFTVNLQKFASQLSHTIQQVTGDIHLPLPDVQLDPQNLDLAVRNPDVMLQLEEALDQWITLLGNVIEQESRKKAVGEVCCSALCWFRLADCSLAGSFVGDHAVARPQRELQRAL